jgi:hypothetical protein
VPANNSLRLDKNQCLFPSGPESPQYHPEQFVRSGKPWLRVSIFQNGKLLPKSQIFQEQIATSTDRANKQNEQGPEQTQHETLVSKHHSCKVNQR